MAVACKPVAVGLLGIRAQDVTLAVDAHPVNGISVESVQAELAVVALGVEETLEALSGVWVAVSGVLKIPIVGAVAADAGAAWNLGVAMEVVGADGATGAWTKRARKSCPFDEFFSFSKYF